MHVRVTYSYKNTLTYRQQIQVLATFQYYVEC